MYISSIEHPLDYIFRVQVGLRNDLMKALELSSNSNEFGRVLLVTPSMFGKLEVHASKVVWGFEPITFYIRELRANSF